MTEINYLKAVELVKAQIALHGEDFVYESPFSNRACVYMYEGQPSCIVGRILYDLGIPVSASLEGSSASSVFRELQVASTYKARIFLDRVQECQDDEIPWGEALTRAQEYTERFQWGESEDCSRTLSIY